MKMKKLMSMVISAAISATFLMPVSLVNADESVLTNIDFEEYSEGTVFSNSSKITDSFGSIGFEYGDDNNRAEIAINSETNSKALKIIKDSVTGQFNAVYEFNDKITDGIYKVMYDIKIESASGNFKSLGTLQSDNYGTIIKPYIFGGTALYYNQSSTECWGTDYKTTIEKSTATFEHIVNMNEKKVTTSVYKDGAKIVNKEYTFECDDFKRIIFGIGKPESNGSFNAWETVTENNPDAVMLVDNIMIEEIDPSIIQSFDFEDYDEGSDLNASNGWAVQKDTGDSITIETDPVSGSKALKLTKGVTTTDMYAEYGLPQPITSGKITVSFDARIASATKYFKTFGETRNEKWISIFGPRIKSTGLYKGDTELNFDYKNNIGYDYATFEQIIDIDNKTVEYNVYKDGVRLLHKEDTHEKDNFMYLNFNITTDAMYHVNAWDCVYDEQNMPDASNPDGVMYVDNIKISTYTFKAQGTSIENGSLNVSKDAQLYVYFNAEPSETSLTSDNFVLYKNSQIMDSSLYSIEHAENGAVKVSPKEGFLYGNTYKLIVNKGILNSDETLSTNKPIETEFTVEKYIDSTVLMEYDFEDYEEGPLSNSSELSVVVADGDAVSVKKDEYGSKALYIERSEENLATKNETMLKFILDEPVTSGMIKITQSFRSENYRAGISNMLSVTNSSWQSTDRSYLHGGYYIPQVGGTYGYIASDVDKTKYLTIEKYINMDSGDYNIYYYIDGELKYKGENLTVNPRTFEHLLIQVTKDDNHSLYGEEGSAKYYFDNIKVEKLNAPEIVWTTPINGAENVQVDSDIILSTSVVLNSDTVNKENITVLKDSQPVDNYSVSVSDEKNIKISFDGSMDKNSEYTITVSNLKTYGENGYTMTKPYSFSFTTGEDFALDIVNVSQNAADTAKMDIAYNAKNFAVSGGFELIFASYDENGKLIEAVSDNKAVNMGEQMYNTVTVTKGAKNVCYVWNTVNNMTPVSDPVEITAPIARTYGADVINNTSDDITIAFIGGSITEQEQWITPLKNYFNEKFSGRNINYVIAGVGGTGSYLQQYRVYNDIIKNSPDLVFVDSTINDSAVSDSCSATYENVIRQLMNSNHQPAVISVAFGSKTNTTDSENWSKAYAAHSQINEYYGIPYINVQAYAEEQIEAGNTSWENITADGTHPNAEGGKLYADYIISVIDSDFTGYIKTMNTNADALNDVSEYKNAREISWREAQFAGEWSEGTRCENKFHDGSVETSVDGSSVTVTFYGKAIAIYNYGGMSGMNIDYNLDDGTKTGTISTFQNSWDFNQAGSTQSITADSVGTHTVTFTARNADNSDAALVIGYFLVY